MRTGMRIGIAALLVQFTSFALAQSFPPGLPAPVENSQGISFARSPSIATDPTGAYPGLYMGYGSSTSNDYLYIEKTTDGVTWGGVEFATLNQAYSPAIVFYNGYLWAAWVSDGGGGLISGALYVAATNSPSSGYWSISPHLVTQTGSPFYPTNSPTMAVYNGQLWITAIDSSQSIVSFATTNGGSFTVSGGCTGLNDPSGYVPQPSAQVGTVAWNGLMYYGYQTTQQTVRVCSTNGSFPASWSYSSEGGYTTGSGVSATVFGSYLTFAFKDNTGSNHVIVEGTANGTYYDGEVYLFSMNGNNEITPGTAVYNNDYYMVLTGNSGDHRMWTTYGY